MMKYIFTFTLVIALSITNAFANSVLGTLEAKSVHCDLIAFVQIKSVNMTEGGIGDMREYVAKCEIIQGFKTPANTTDVDIYFLNDAHTTATYEDL